MKKLFTIKSCDILSVVEEGSVYGTFSYAENKYTFLDDKGNILKDYVRTPAQDQDVNADINDPDFYEEIGEGFYKYTTHTVNHDPDGDCGLFGIKRNNGQRITEEIYCRIGRFYNGLCSVGNQDGKWGCIDSNGILVIGFNFDDEIIFNQYGVAVGDFTLIDKAGNEIPDTALNYIEDCGESNRYYVFSHLSDQQLDSAYECGAEPSTVDIYDTKSRVYVVKNLPELRLDVYCFDGKPEVIAAAAGLIDRYDSICLQKSRSIFCKKGNSVTTDRAFRLKLSSY